MKAAEKSNILFSKGGGSMVLKNDGSKNALHEREQSILLIQNYHPCPQRSYT